MTLTVASLFDGIGGFPLAFERAGATTVATVEIDPEAAAISRRHFPHAHQFDDVTKVTGDDLRAVGFVPDRGILTAGWPCQDFSVAGRRAGLDGARSGLWWEVVRILAELKPRWFLGENVPGLLSSVCDPEYVEVTSVLVTRAARNRRARHATGVVTGYNDVGIVVQFDGDPVNGIDWCTADPLELRRLT